MFDASAYPKILMQMLEYLTVLRDPKTYVMIVQTYVMTH
jgi:hypothetical protein